MPSSRAIRGVGSAAETHQLHVVLGEVVSPVLPADGELAGHAGGSSGVDAARSKLTSRRGSIRFFSSQEVPADRPRRKLLPQIRVSLPVHGACIPRVESIGSAKKPRAARRAVAYPPARVVLVESRESTRRPPRRLGAPSPTPRARLPGFEASSAVFSRREPRAGAKTVPSKATTRSARPPRRPCPRLAGASSFALVRTTTWSAPSWTSCASSSTASLP